MEISDLGSKTQKQRGRNILLLFATCDSPHSETSCPSFCSKVYGSNELENSSVCSSEAALTQTGSQEVLSWQHWSLWHVPSARLQRVRLNQRSGLAAGSALPAPQSLNSDTRSFNSKPGEVWVSKACTQLAWYPQVADMLILPHHFNTR